MASNADVVHTYGELLAGHARGRTEARRLKAKRFSMSLFVLHFGAKKTWPGLAHHTILFGESYRELVADICGAKPLRDDFSLYLHAPCVTDLSLAPPGSSAFYVLSPVPNLRQDIDWRVEGPKYADSILRALEARLLPELRENLVTTRIFTPADFKTELNAHLGSAFSLEPVLSQSAYFRVHNRDDVIRNLYFVGAGTHRGRACQVWSARPGRPRGVILDDLAKVAA